jgi:hypothetical protein
MTTLTSSRYRLDHQGHVFEVETASSGLSTIARLFVDGVQVDEQKRAEGPIHLEGGQLTIVVSLNWLGQVTQILAVPSGTDPKKADEEGIAFTPPEGSRAAKLETLKRDHPELYAARHIVIAILQVLFSVLGIGALLGALLPRIGVPDIPWPDLPAVPWPDLPDIPVPDIPWPAIEVPDLPFLGVIREIWSSVNWVVPIVIAVLVAINEIQKRRKREKVEAARRQDRAAEAARSG